MNIKYIIPSALVLVLAGCSKSFLEVDPQGQLTEEQVLVDPNAATNLVTGVYNSLYFGSFDPTTVGFQYYIATDVASDDADKGSTPSDYPDAQQIDNFTVTPNNSILNNLWQGYFRGISRANTAIDALEDATFDATTKNRLIGEVSYIRGLYYFNLVRLFGGVPLVTSVPDAGEFNSDQLQTRATREAVYAQIIQDLQFAVDNLPMKGEEGSTPGRATKGAAQGLLAKVYMYQGEWQQVLDLTNQVISSNKYSLVTDDGEKLNDYNVIFRENPGPNGQGGNNNSESLFEVQAGVNETETGVSRLYSNGQGPRGRGGWNDLGFGFNNPTQNLASAYESGDTRREGTIIFVQPTGGANEGTVLWDGFRIPTQDSVENPRYNYKGYHSPIAESNLNANNKDTRPKNIRIMRYAEILLMNAEAALHQGGDALTPLNAIRKRAGLTELDAATEVAIWNERRLELAMEQDRFFDLVRQGRAAQVLQAHGKNFVAGKHEVFPIPQAQIDLSGGRLEQNNY